LVGRAAALLGSRAPVVHTFHGLPLVGEGRSPAELAFLIAERILARRTARFFSQARGDVERAIRLGIARPRETFVIGNGTDLERFTPRRPDRAETRAELGIPTGAVVVTCVARLVREKGILDLAEAAARNADLDRIHVLLVGRALPSDRTDITAELAAHPVTRLLGPRWQELGERGDADRILRASDVFVLPSYREGLPRSIIEAMASGLPVIATAIPACEELVSEGESGTLVPPGDVAALAAAIRRLVVDAGVRERMGRRARDHAVDHFDEREVLARQIELLAEVVAR
jgi:glycosyltransferase involved in cell wall biosynthesis